MNDPYDASEPDHKAFLGEDDVPDLDLFKEDLPLELSFLSGGDLIDSEDPKDQFITGTAKGEMRTTADLARFLPPEDLAALNAISHPVKEEFLDPYLNANLALPNLDLIYQQWMEQEPNADLRKLAFVIAATSDLTNTTFHCLAPSLEKADWEQEDIKAGYWKRGFIGLTGQEDYQRMSEEMGLDFLTFPALANIPSIAVQIIGIGMFQTGFTSGRTLDDYFGSGIEQWERASEILGRKDEGALGRLAQEIFADIKAFLWSDEKKQGMRMTQYLIQNGNSGAFAGARQADAIRILRVLGHLPHEVPTPSLNEEGEPNQEELKSMHFRYEVEKAVFGTQIGLSDTFEDGLKVFSKHINQQYPLPEPLLESGDLNRSAFHILTLGGHQVRTGEPTVHYGFSQKLQPVNPFAKAFRDHREGNLGIVQLARLLLQYLPIEQTEQLMEYFHRMTPQESQRLSYELSRQANAEQLSLIEGQLLKHMKDLILTSGKEKWLSEIERLDQTLANS